MPNDLENSDAQTGQASWHEIPLTRHHGVLSLFTLITGISTISVFNKPKDDPDSICLDTFSVDESGPHTGIDGCEALAQRISSEVGEPVQLIGQNFIALDPALAVTVLAFAAAIGIAIFARLLVDKELEKKAPAPQQAIHASL